MKRTCLAIVLILVTAWPIVADSVRRSPAGVVIESVSLAYGLAASVVTLLPASQVYTDGEALVDYTASRLAGNLLITTSAVLGLAVENPRTRRVAQSGVDVAAIATVLAYSAFTSQGAGDERRVVAMTVGIPALIHLISVWVIR